MIVLGVFLAGGAGAIARYLVDAFVQRRPGTSFPYGVLVINVSGSLLLGLLTGFALYHAFPHTPQVILGTGFCGGYTTFSTHALDTVALVEHRRTRAALYNVLANLFLATAAAAIGMGLASL